MKEYTVEELKVLLLALWAEDCTREQLNEIRAIFREANPNYNGTY